MRGIYLVKFNGAFICLSNTIPLEGEQEFLKMMLRADDTLIAAGGNIYMGLTSLVPTQNSDLTDVLAAEPTIGVNGYARQAITRDATGWPTLSTVGGHAFLRSTTETFTASGGDFDAAITRPFLTEILTGSAGKLLSLGAALSTAVTVSPGTPLLVQYEMHLY